MGERIPTIEQNSVFTAKTKEGKDVEFVATIKFYIDPAGQVMINTPGGGSPTGRGPSNTAPDTPFRDREPLEGIDDGLIEKSGEQVEVFQKSGLNTHEKMIDPKPGGDELPQKQEGILEDEYPQTKKRFERKRRARLEREEDPFPRHPESNCPITQFIPDPCRAIDDLQKSIRGVMNSFFGGRKCGETKDGHSMPKSHEDHLPSQVGELIWDTPKISTEEPVNKESEPLPSQVGESMWNRPKISTDEPVNKESEVSGESSNVKERKTSTEYSDIKGKKVNEVINNEEKYEL